MNRQIVQLFGLSMLLFATLIAFTSRWAVFEAGQPRGRDGQPAAPDRGAADPARPDPGLATARVLARSVPRGRGQQRTFMRSYPDRRRSSPTRWATTSSRRAGPASSAPATTSSPARRTSSARSSAELQSEDREGEDVTTTLDPEGQRAALQALGGRRGSVVAIEPQTGRVRVMVSVPEYDPNDVPERFKQLNSGEGAPLLQPRDPVALSARIDVQGGHRRRGARQRQVHARTRSSTAPRRARSAACRWPTRVARTSARSRSPTPSRTR